MSSLKRALVAIVTSIAVVVVVGALSAGRACAHDPRFVCSPRPPADAVVVRDAAKSWAFYGRLSAVQSDHFTVSTARAIRVPTSLLVDERDAANPARPYLSVYDRRGSKVASIDMNRIESFYEPFSRVRYLSSQERSVQLSAGTYDFVVAMHGARSAQRYTLALGSEERFGVAELPFVLGAVVRIHNRDF